MKILVFAAFYHPYKGGYVESLHSLTKSLAARGHQVTVVAGDTHHSGRDDLMDGVKVVRLACWNPGWLNSSYPIPSPASLIKIWRRLKKEKYDLVSTQTRFYLTTAFGFIFAKANRLPMVHTERGSRHTASANPLIFSAGWLIDHTLGWLVCRFSEAVAGVSKAACRFAAHLGARTPILIYNGIDVDLWRREGIEEKEIVFVGRLVYGKGAQDLIKAAASINLKFKINIVGDGPYRSVLEKLVSDLGLADKVNFLGELDSAGVRSVLSRAMMLINPSYSEGLPRSVLEAGAMGLPIIATDVGGTREILRDENHGTLFTAGEISQLSQKIEELLKDESRRQKIGQNVKNYVQSNFSGALCAASTEKLFLAVIAKSAGRKFN